MPAKDKINLLPKEQFETSNLGKLVQWAVDIGRWIVVLTEFVVICAFLSRFYFDTKLANLFDEVKQKQAIVNSASSFEENFRTVQDKIKIIKGMLAEERKPSATIAEISQFLPLDTFLTSINLDSEKLSLSGYCLSERSLNVFLSQLVSKSSLKEVSLNSVSSSKDDSPGITFNIDAQTIKWTLTKTKKAPAILLNCRK